KCGPGSFFFSSRRRHTRCYRDWSSDVCSSDLGVIGCGRIAANHFKAIEAHRNDLQLVAVCDNDLSVLETTQRQYGVPGYSSLPRSEERRVGKERASQWWSEAT